MHGLIDILIFFAVLGSGLVAGIFFAFSSFVMRALGRLPYQQGSAAMKAINVTVINPLFFLAFSRFLERGRCASRSRCSLRVSEITSAALSPQSALAVQEG